MPIDVVGSQLDSLEEERKKLLAKLPWYKRFYRRYMTGDSFWAYQISSVMTWPQALVAGFALNKLWAGWVVTYPTATGLVTKVWGGVTTTAAGVWQVITHVE